MQIRLSKLIELFALQDDIRQCMVSDEWEKFHDDLQLLDHCISNMATRIGHIDKKKPIINREGQ